MGCYHIGYVKYVLFFSFIQLHLILKNILKSHYCKNCQCWENKIMNNVQVTVRETKLTHST